MEHLIYTKKKKSLIKRQERQVSLDPNFCSNLDLNLLLKSTVPLSTYYEVTLTKYMKQTVPKNCLLQLKPFTIWSFATLQNDKEENCKLWILALNWNKIDPNLGNMQIHSNHFSLHDIKQTYKIRDAEENWLTKYSLLSFMVEAVKLSPFMREIR